MSLYTTTARYNAICSNISENPCQMSQWRWNTWRSFTNDASQVQIHLWFAAETNTLKSSQYDSCYHCFPFPGNTSLDQTKSLPTSHLFYWSTNMKTKQLFFFCFFLPWQITAGDILNHCKKKKKGALIFLSELVSNFIAVIIT